MKGRQYKLTIKTRTKLSKQKESNQKGFETAITLLNCYIQIGDMSSQSEG